MKLAHEVVAEQLHYGQATIKHLSEQPFGDLHLHSLFKIKNCGLADWFTNSLTRRR